MEVKITGNKSLTNGQDSIGIAGVAGKALASKYTYIAYVFLLSLFVYRLVIIMQPYLSLFFDEAYYYHWSQTPDFGYYSKPPMVGWLIALSTKILGVSDFSVKFFSPILYAITTFLLFQIASVIASRRVACFAVIVFSTAPLVGFNSLFITTDAPLFFFWALTIYFLLRCERENTWADWLCLGVSLGLGMMSKYTFAVLPVGLMGYLVTSKQWHFLIERKMWVAIVLALMIASSNWIWNAVHHFVAFSHTHEIARIDGKLLNIKSLLTFLVTQFAIFGFVTSVVVLIKRKHLSGAFSDTKYFHLVLWVTLPILVTIGLQALLSRAFANWAGPYMVGASILAAIALSQMKLRVLVIAATLNLSILAAFNHLPSIYSMLNIEQTRKNSPYSRVAGWKDIANVLKENHPSISDNIIVSQNRDMLAYIGFYTGSHVSHLSYWNEDVDNIRNHYDLKSNAGEVLLKAEDAFFASKDLLSLTIISKFDEVKFLGEYQVTPMEGVTRVVYLYRVSGFKGY